MVMQTIGPCSISLLASPNEIQIPYMIRFLSHFPYSPFYLPILHFHKTFFLFLVCILHYVAFMLWLCCLFYLLWLNLISPLRPSYTATSSTQLSLFLLCINFISTLSGPLICHLRHHTVKEYVLSTFQPISSSTSELPLCPSLSYITVPPSITVCSIIG